MDKILNPVYLFNGENLCNISSHNKDLMSKKQIRCHIIKHVDIVQFILVITLFII